ncbi:MULTISPECIES: ABC transporter [Rhodococcus]|uniref:ABC transporter n=1 Tax=Rhodococcus oxybenzonivorans TaxID=1990687 RepID=A0AAE4V3S7_9NOCA|nr:MULTISPECIES: ABC transporter [Rhodococcus]MDV7241471.1 ABC transporter [Rhodococcus oxybenzonivorans]MDV7267604.1 ABC transporter [Rhodococcus oxybenzonivorans]MDV7273996.1 ABC transporter [Rhodococcus oxybenzonivorans]MDV7333752.1 ABC transporter [Rhodococcus oxybenzonivorans]MDV7343171.1 ABC transporter [Rhodococcus oxybenzonivorans]
MQNTTLVRAAIATSITALVLTGCGSDATGETAPTGQTRPGSDLAAEAGATEVEGPEPRLVVADALSGRVDVLDLTTADKVHSFQFDHPTVLTTVKDRYAFAVDASGGTVHVVDAGSWTIDHGDHNHSYTKAPIEIGKLTGERPGAVVIGDDKVATFFDADGRADVIDFAQLRKDSAEVGEVVPSASAHAGMVIPVADRYLVSRSGTGAGAFAPASFELRNADGRVETVFDVACPAANGHAVFDSYALAACDDGVFLARVTGGQWTAEKIPYPEGIGPSTRPTAFRGTDGTPLLAATAGSPTANDGVLLLDPLTHHWTHVRTPTAALDVNLSGDGHSLFAVLADGTFRVFDAASGAETASASVLTGDKLHESATITVGGNRAYVTDPEAKAVIEIDYRDNARIARRLDVGISASSVSVVGS